MFETGMPLKTVNFHSVLPQQHAQTVRQLFFPSPLQQHAQTMLKIDSLLQQQFRDYCRHISKPLAVSPANQH